jgi:hypothetical protein
VLKGVYSPILAKARSPAAFRGKLPGFFVGVSFARGTLAGHISHPQGQRCVDGDPPRGGLRFVRVDRLHYNEAQ